MAIATNYTILKFDGVTNIVYDALAGSPGDGQPAFFRQDTGANAAVPVGFRPVWKLMTKWNGSKSARQTTFEFSYPYVTQDSTTWLYQSKDKCVFTGIATTPQAIPAATINEFAYQLGNLMGHAQTKGAIASGFAPN